ncbi:MAG: transporter substrate-binding domain-containing protein [Sheuella sp.]|jgi:glutamate/aspartate transport system substrate-binding protein|nr:transporter substrate-binding domain-containing protein [Sheuella sp.]
MKALKTAGLLIAATLMAQPAFSQELTGTLKKIKDSGTITLGARESSAPFSYSLGGTQFVGFSVDLMMKVVDRLKTELKMPDLKYTIIPFTAQNRIPLIQNGTLDFECSSTTNTLERQQQVAFSTSFFVIGTKLLTAKDSGIKDFTDLKGKNLSTTAGTTSERLINKYNETQNAGINVMAARENTQSFLAVDSGRAVAFMMDDAILYGERAKSKNPDKWTVVGTPMSREAYGCMMRRDDAPFKKLVDEVLTEQMKSGAINANYKKWFESPIPPRNTSLDFPQSADLKALYANPNDKAIE